MFFFFFSNLCYIKTANMGQKNMHHFVFDCSVMRISPKQFFFFCSDLGDKKYVIITIVYL